jgi:hypothetical protein
MPFPISLIQTDYEALVEMARRGTFNPDGTINSTSSLALEAFLTSIEKAAGIQRYAVWVQWQEAGAPLPPNTNFPTVWPPEQRFYLALVSRPIAKDDVDKMLQSKAREPQNVLVTRDPTATVGWQDYATFFK